MDGVQLFWSSIFFILIIYIDEAYIYIGTTMEYGNVCTLKPQLPVNFPMRGVVETNVGAQTMNWGTCGKSM